MIAFASALTLYASIGQISTATFVISEGQLGSIFQIAIAYSLGIVVSIIDFGLYSYRDSPRAYTNLFISHTIPSLLSPFVQVHLEVTFTLLSPLLKSSSRVSPLRRHPSTSLPSSSVVSWPL